MDIFISWSGPRSRAVAETLKEYLPMIVNAFNPWLSTADIDKGARWSAELSTALTTAKAGIICLTPNNLTAPYILFEAGAISKTVEKPYVCTLLIGMEPSDVSGPLSQFQATKPTKDDLRQLMKTLNKAVGENALKDSQLEGAFELCWPKIDEKFSNLPTDGALGRPHRTERELLEELVGSVRSTAIEDDVNKAQTKKTLTEILERLEFLEASIRPHSQTFNVDPTRMQTLRYLYEAAQPPLSGEATIHSEKNFYGETPAVSDSHHPMLKLKPRLRREQAAKEKAQPKEAEPKK